MSKPIRTSHRNRFFFLLFSILTFSAIGASHAESQRARDLVNEHLQASRGDLQKKRAVVLSEETFEQMSRVDFMIKLTSNDIDTLVDPLLEALNKAAKKEGQSLDFKSMDVNLGPQSLTFDTSVVWGAGDQRILWGIISRDVRIYLNLQLSAYVAAVNDGLALNLYYDGFEVTEIDGPLGIPKFIAKWVINAVARLDPIINAVVDEAINDAPEKALILRVTDKDLLSQNLGDFSTASVSIGERKIVAGLQSEAAAIAIGEDGLYALVQAAFKKPEDIVKSKIQFPKDEDLLRFDTGDIRQRVESYQNAVSQKLLTLGEEDARRLLFNHTASGVAVSGNLVAQLLRVASEEATTAEVSFDESDESKTDISAKIEKDNCSGYFKGCDHREICRSNSCQTTTTDRVVGHACKLHCAKKYPHSSRKRKGCRNGCAEDVSRVIDVISPACNAFREIDRNMGGQLCSIAGHVDATVCSVDANVRNAVCKTEQEIGRYFEGHAFATVSANSTINGEANFSAKNIILDPNLQHVSIDVGVSGQATLVAHIEYDRHIYLPQAALPPEVTLGMLCAFDWHETIGVDAHLDQFDRTLNVPSEWTTSDQGSLMVKMSVEPFSARFDFETAPVAELMKDQPNVVANCPLMFVSAAQYGSMELVFKEQDARKVLPLVSGEDYYHKFEGVEFETEVDPLEICIVPNNDDQTSEETAGCKGTSIKLSPKVGGGAIAFLAAETP